MRPLPIALWAPRYHLVATDRNDAGGKWAGTVAKFTWLQVLTSELGAVLLQERIIG